MGEKMKRKKPARRRITATKVLQKISSEAPWQLMGGDKEDHRTFLLMVKIAINEYLRQEQDDKR